MRSCGTEVDSLGFIDQHPAGTVLLENPKPNQNQVNIQKQISLY